MAAISAATRTALESVSAPFHLPDTKLVEITNSLIEEFNAGLKEPGRPVQMAATFVGHVANGTEAGTFITLDLLWKTLRVSEVTLDGRHKSSRRDKFFDIPTGLLAGNCAGFFDYIATSVKTFLQELNVQMTTQLSIGFTFPFPIRKTGLDKGKLVAWGKGLSTLQDGPGQNVEELLQQAFERNNVNVKCGAIVNDTVAVLLSESYGHPEENCHIAAIFGIGTNGAYVEQTKNIIKLGKQKGTQMIVNTELGGFSKKDVLPLTPIDVIMDEDARKPGVSLFEKLVSWVFLGELVRRILVSLTQTAPHTLSKGVVIGLTNPGSFNSMCLPLIDEAKVPGDIKKALTDIGLPFETATDEDAEVIRWVSRLVIGRAIKLCACAVASLVIKAGFTGDQTDKIAVALSGEIVHFIPQFEGKIRKALKGILGESVEKRIFFLVAQDAEAIGASLAIYEMEYHSHSSY